MENIVDMKGYRLREGFDDGEPRIRDLELGKRLGYARPRRIRDMIARLGRDGKLNDINRCPAVGRRDDGMPSPHVVEYWLTEKQALKVIAKSDTATADAILDEVIDIFVAYRRGRLLPRLLADEMSHWDRLWDAATCSDLCGVYGYRMKPGRYPQFLGNMQARLYALTLGKGDYAEMKRRNPDPRHGSNHHQMLTEQARAAFAKHLSVIAAAARSHYGDPEGFWSLMEQTYLGHPIQLPLIPKRLN